jgi:mRNA-degrading endonuclease HigB of HigAB toxin-antitoxin module
LKGAHYPTDKQHLIKKAISNHAHKNLVAFLEQIPNQEYDTPADVQRHIGGE